MDGRRFNWLFSGLKGINKDDLHEIFSLKTNIRMHNKGDILDKFRVMKEIGKNWCRNRVVDEWK